MQKWQLRFDDCRTKKKYDAIFLKNDNNYKLIKTEYEDSSISMLAIWQISNHSQPKVFYKKRDKEKKKNKSLHRIDNQSHYHKYVC